MSIKRKSSYVRKEGANGTSKYQKLNELKQSLIDSGLQDWVDDEDLIDNWISDNDVRRHITFKKQKSVDRDIDYVPDVVIVHVKKGKVQLPVKKTFELLAYSMVELQDIYDNLLKENKTEFEALVYTIKFVELIKPEEKPVQMPKERKTDTIRKERTVFERVDERVSKLNKLIKEQKEIISELNAQIIKLKRKSQVSRQEYDLERKVGKLENEIKLLNERNLELKRQNSEVRKKNEKMNIELNKINPDKKKERSKKNLERYHELYSKINPEKKYYKNKLKEAKSNTDELEQLKKERRQLYYKTYKAKKMGLSSVEELPAKVYKTTLKVRKAAVQYYNKKKNNK